MKSQALFDAMSAAVKSKGPELVKMGGAVTWFLKRVPHVWFLLCHDVA